ncbi:MAG: hypothetical protein J0M00_20790 [Burkholderiales bacterium]|nr:hypothetical protein [Burkholderiales bacterium]
MPAHDIVLLTATVVPPPDVRNLARRDPKLRLQDYLQAFDFYLALLRAGSLQGLVLCENSGYDLAPFVARARAAGLARQVELIGHHGLDHPAIWGRGYGEFKLVDHAMRQSALIQAQGPAARVWKVTGRYRVPNLARLIATQPTQADLYCHCRNWPLRWTDLYLLRWNQRAYRTLIEGAYRRLQQDDTPTSAEQHFRMLIDGPQAAGLHIVRRFRQVPRIEGVRGFDNRVYQAMRSKWLAREFTHRVAPWLWI